MTIKIPCGVANPKSEIRNPKFEWAATAAARFWSAAAEFAGKRRNLQGSSLRIIIFIIVFTFSPVSAETPATNALPGDQMLSEYFINQKPWEPEPKTLVEWQKRRSEYQIQFAEMLGLLPPPARTDLQPVITGKLEYENIVVEKLHFQSMPGLYVTANLYLPKNVAKPAPTILYVCGHGPVITNGISYGNKVSYQHHGIWFARHGYVCLIIDTLQLGEIQGLHHGTYREGMWWWNSRGYTPAGVETWNSIRALDYLCARPEVDKERLGVTGRSGGGAYSWFLIALDERVKVAAPVAGITDLQNHVIDGTVEGHCDCMFFVNTYRWDYPRLAELAAPRPLLLVNTDSDTIFPLDGVMRTHALVKNIYKLYNASANFGLVIGPGPHKDTQNLQIPVFRWFNQHLKGEDPVIDTAAVKLFTPHQLKVFDRLPADAINTNIQAVFVPRAKEPLPPSTQTEWQTQTNAWLLALKEKCFAGWPDRPGSPYVATIFAQEKDGVLFEILQLKPIELAAAPRYSQPAEPSSPEKWLHFVLMRQVGMARTEQVVLRVADESLNPTWAAAEKATNRMQQVLSAFGLETEPGKTDPMFQGNTTRLCLLPRGVGPTAWSGDAKKQAQIRRRFMLVGQTLDGMRVWDIARGVRSLRDASGSLLDRNGRRPFKLILEAEGTMAVNTLYASFLTHTISDQYVEGIDRLQLSRLPASHLNGPDYLNVLKYLDIPQAVAMAASRYQVTLIQPEGSETKWNYPLATAKNLGWPADRLVIKSP